MKKSIFFISIIAVLLSGCFGEIPEQEWTSLIYPQKDNTKRSKKNGIYSSLEECRKASIKELTKLDLSTIGTYTCGLNCSYHEGMKVEICEKTSK